MTSMIMTRYLYIKDEVVVAVISSMLESNEQALYWAYELYYSGFEGETINLICKIYYFFFATKNPDIEPYLLDRVSQWNRDENESIVADILTLLILRPLDTDVFLLHRIATYLDYDADIATFDLKKMTHMDIAAYAVAHPEECAEKAPQIVAHFGTAAWPFIPFSSLVPIVFISRCISSPSPSSPSPSPSPSLEEINKKKKIDISMYKTKEITPSYMQLRTVCIPIDPQGYLAMFDVPRRRIPNAMNIYHTCWLLCASYSTIWAKRIALFGGARVGNKIVFKTEEREEAFHIKYGYEPDEQPMEVQYRNIPPIVETKTWGQIVRKGIFPATEWEMEMIENL